MTAQTVTVTVDDDEFASTGLWLSANIKEVLESAGATAITVTVELNGAPRLSDTPVTVSVGGGTSTATSGTDFATVSDFTVTIAAGTLSQTATFDLTPTDDDVDEGYFESVAVSGTSTVSALSSVIGTAVNILDDDDRGVTVSDSSLTVKEGSSETYTVVLDSRPTGDVTVTPSRTSGDTDVTVSGALTFTPDNWSSEQTVTVRAAEDLDGDDDTAEIGHAVSGGDYGSVTAQTVTVTVDDDEFASTGLWLSANIKEVLESAGATAITVTVELNGAPRLSDTPVTVSVGGGTSTATSGTDFATVSDFTVTIAAGTLSQTATFDLTPTDDDVDEGYFESVAVSGTSTVSALSSVIGTAVNILDDDDRGVTVSDSSLTVKEGSSETYTVVLDSRPTGDVTVTPSRTSGDADVTVSGALTFTPDNWSSEQTVTVRAAEDLDGDDDTAEIGHAVSGGDYGSVTAQTVTVTVDDDEFASTGLWLSANIKEVLESAGATAITVTVELNGAPRLSDTPVEVSVGGGTSTATSGTDFATVSDFTVTIAAGTLSQTATFDLTPTDDDVDEGYFESVAVSGTSTVSALSSVIGTAVNILDDDDRGVTVSDSSLTVKEGSSETYTVVLDSRPTGDVTVTPSRTSGDTDVTVSGALTFTPDNWSSEQTVTVRAAEDLDGDDDTAMIGHAVSGGDYGSETAGSVTVTVDDDEFASTGLWLSANIKEVLESAGATAITVTVELNGAPRLSDTPVTVSVGGGTSTATSGTDFATVSDFTVTIAAGTLSQTATFDLTPTDDDVDEGYFESVAVSGTSTVSALSSVIGTAVNILDDDDRGVTVSDSSLTVKEGSSETYTVVLDSEPTGDVTVTPSRTSGDTDVTVSGALTFTPDNWSSAQTVTVRAAEDLDAIDDTAEIDHAVSGGDYGSETAQTVTVTVDDDEFASTGLLLSANIKEVLESAGATVITVTATLNRGARLSDTPVTVSVGAGTSTATAGTDFATVNDFTVTIAAGTLSQTATFTLEPTDDDVDEGYFESVEVSGTSTVSALSSVIGTAVNILDDDDAPTVTLVLTPESIEESDDSDTSSVQENRAVVTATLNWASGVATTVTVSVLPNAPAVAGDYSLSANKELMIAAGSKSSTGTVTITAVDNVLGTADKTVAVKGSATNTLGIIGPADRALTILDDDRTQQNNRMDPTEVLLSVDNQDVLESAGATTITVTAALDQELMADLSVTLTVSAGTATETEDFVPIAPLTIEIDAGRTEGTTTFVLTPVDDAIDEDDETVVIQGTAANGGVTIEPEAGLTLTIIDDDNRRVFVAPTQLSLQRNDSGKYTVVLDSEPTDMVMITISTVKSDTSITFEPDSLMFSTQDWMNLQEVTVRSNSKLETVTIKNGVQGGGYDDIRADDVVVSVIESQAESAAEKQSLTITDRMLLNSVVGVFDNRRRTSFSRDSDKRQRSPADRVEAVLYELAKMASATGHEHSSYRGSSMGQTDAGIGIGQSWGEGEADGSMSGIKFDIGDDSGVLVTSGELFWEQLWGRSFEIPLNVAGEDVSQSEGGPEWTLWGSADLQTASGTPEGGRYDGELRSVYLGVDRNFGQDWLAGVAVSRSTGDVDYSYKAADNTVEGLFSTTSLSSLYPYMHGRLSKNLEIWMVGGFGSGDVAATRYRLNRVETGDLNMELLAGGFGLDLAQIGTLRLSLIGDAGYTSLKVENSQGDIAGLESSINRYRVGMEGEYDLPAVRPFWQLSARSDGGDGQTGSGLDLVTGVRYERDRIRFDAQGRWLRLHSASNYREFSATASLTIVPKEDGTGLTVRFSPSWGGAGGGSFGSLWETMRLWNDQSPTTDLNRSVENHAALSFEGEIGYGFRPARGILTPKIYVSQDKTGEYSNLFGVGYVLSGDSFPGQLEAQLPIGPGANRSGRLIGIRYYYQF